jgi:DNA primase
VLDKALEKIDTREFLEYFGGCSHFSQNGEWINCSCPFHQDKNPSFGMHSKTKIWNCFSGCGGGDAISFIQKARDTSRLEAIRKIYEFAANVFEDEDYDPERLQKKIKSLLVIEKELELPEYNPSIIEQWRYIHPYMMNRGFTEPRIYHNFKCGYSREHDRLTFPIFFLDRLVGVQGRRVDNQKPKYMPIPGYEFKQGKLIFNLCPEYDRVLIVEGILDCIRMWSYGALNTVSIFSSHMSDEQAKIILDNFNEVVLWLDRDEAGTKGILNAINKLGGNIKIWVAGYYKNKTDPAEHSLQESMMVRSNIISSTKWLVQRRL